MKIIGLTGPTGSGKSTLCTVAKQMGVEVIDCDRVAHTVTEKGSETLLKLVKKFGNDIILPDGSLDRRLLARKAFSSPEQTELLNSIIFPDIIQKIKQMLKSAEDKNAVAVILDAPTLYESGVDSLCDDVIAVLSDEKLRLERIIKRDNLSQADALTRLSAQKDDDFFTEKTQNIIYNNATSGEFINKCKNILEKVIG